MRHSTGAGKVWKGVAVFVGLIACIVWAPQWTVSAGTAAGADAKPKGRAEAGRSVFNGKGVCYYCHGLDGYGDKRPQLADETAALIAQLDPKPADLRDPKSLKLTSDKQRAKAIREGHPGTGMFPDTTMTDRDLADTLAYLAVLRAEGRPKAK